MLFIVFNDIRKGHPISEVAFNIYFMRYLSWPLVIFKSLQKADRLMKSFHTFSFVVLVIVCH